MHPNGMLLHQLSHHYFLNKMVMLFLFIITRILYYKFKT